MTFENYIDDNYREVILLSFIFEGVYDPSIFKAIFLAGGPGSGKSFVARKTTSGMGLKMVNSDTLFEKMAKDAKIDLKNMKIGSSGPEELKRNAIRDRAKSLTSKQMDKYIQGRLGMVIDGTGRRYGTTSEQKKRLENIGYDTYMIFVNTSLDVALERNKKRGEKPDGRSVPEEVVKGSWKAVQNNIGKFQNLFGVDKFKIVDNSVYVDDKHIFSEVWKEVMKFTKKPLQNRIAKEWVNAALAKKKGDL